MIKVGTKMIGNWGAMIPLSYGVVTDVVRDYKGVDVEVEITWDDSETAISPASLYWISEIDKGSNNEIGIYTEENFYNNNAEKQSEYGII